MPQKNVIQFPHTFKNVVNFTYHRLFKKYDHNHISHLMPFVSSSTARLLPPEVGPWAHQERRYQNHWQRGWGRDEAATSTSSRAVLAGLCREHRRHLRGDGAGARGGEGGVPDVRRER